MRDNVPEMFFQSRYRSAANNGMDCKQNPTDLPASPPGRSWRNIVTMAGLVVLGVTPWAQAQMDPPNMPAICPPLTAFATPSMFDVFWGTTPIRFPFQ